MPTRQNVIDKGNELISRYLHIISNDLPVDNPKYGISHEEANLWYANAEALLIEQQSHNNKVIEEWVELKESLRDEIGLAIRREWHSLQGYHDHVSKCLQFILKNTKEIHQQTLFDKLITLIIKLFKPKFHNIASLLLISSGIAMLTTTIFDRILGETLQKYFEISIDNEPNPEIGMPLIILGLFFWLYVDKNSSNKTLERNS